MPVTVVVGAQWGDEGKGKIVDWLSERADVICRFQGGHNAGHTLVIDGKVYKLHALPSGVVRGGKLSVIGNGVVLDPWHLMKEIETIRGQGVEITPETLMIAENTPLILPIHGELDRAREEAASKGTKIGTTGRGIGPAYEDKVGRRSVRVADLADRATLEARVDRALQHHDPLRKGLGFDPVDRDALLAQTCTSVFGLIGFSGKPGREAEMLAYNSKLLPHYGDDWWCLSQYAFALCETGNLAEADIYIERSLALNPRNANGAHVRSHIYYETGDIDLGIAYLTEWLGPYDRAGYMHGHLSWHAALWALEQGDTQTMWQRMETDILPDVSQSLPINVLTDAASLLFRAELAGVEVPQHLWREISTYALQFFPKTGIGFVDIHAALAHAMAGNGEALMQIIADPNPNTGDVVTPLAEAFRALAQQNWAEATALLIGAMGDHARLGGSRAQRDLLEFALLGALLKQGKDEEAKHLLALRRPALVGTQSVHGLSVH